MKIFNTIKKIAFVNIIVFALFSCEKEGDSYNISKETVYPTLEVLGDQVDIILVGSAYTDPGVKGFEGTKEIEVETIGTVDPNTPGVYIITYTAVNTEGYPATERRWVGVCTQEALDADLTGKYQRDAGKKGISTWTKIESGLYQCTDLGGAALPDDWVYVFNITANVIVVPEQPIGGTGSDAFCTNADGGSEIDYIPGAINEKAYSWVVVNSGYGTPLRNFLRVN